MAPHPCLFPQPASAVGLTSLVTYLAQKSGCTGAEQENAVTACGLTAGTRGGMRVRVRRLQRMSRRGLPDLPADAAGRITSRWRRSAPTACTGTKPARSTTGRSRCGSATPTAAPARSASTCSSSLSRNWTLACRCAPPASQPRPVPCCAIVTPARLYRRHRHAYGNVAPSLLDCSSTCPVVNSSAGMTPVDHASAADRPTPCTVSEDPAAAAWLRAQGGPLLRP